jgi:hypothetical protein
MILNKFKVRAPQFSNVPAEEEEGLRVNFVSNRYFVDSILWLLL